MGIQYTLRIKASATDDNFSWLANNISNWRGHTPELISTYRMKAEIYRTSVSRSDQQDAFSWMTQYSTLDRYLAENIRQNVLGVYLGNSREVRGILSDFVITDAGSTADFQIITDVMDEVGFDLGSIQAILDKFGWDSLRLDWS